MCVCWYYSLMLEGGTELLLKSAFFDFVLSGVEMREHFIIFREMKKTCRDKKCSQCVFLSIVYHNLSWFFFITCHTQISYIRLSKQSAYTRLSICMYVIYLEICTKLQHHHQEDQTSRVLYLIKPKETKKACSSLLDIPSHIPRNQTRRDVWKKMDKAREIFLKPDSFLWDISKIRLNSPLPRRPLARRSDSNAC